MRPSETIALSDRQAALLATSKGYVVLLALPVLVFFRSNDYPPIVAFGICIAILIFLSAAALIILLALQTKAAKSRGQPRRGIQNDLDFRILLAGLCATIVAFLDIYDQAAPYALAVAAAVALSMRLLQLASKARPNAIEATLGLCPLYDLALALILFIVTFSMFARPAEPQPSHAMVADWAVVYIAALRAWQMREALASRSSETTS